MKNYSVVNKLFVLIVFILTGSATIKMHAAGQHDKELFNVVVNLDYQYSGVDLSRDSIDFNAISAKLMTKVNELAKNKKFTVAFSNTDKSTSTSLNVTDKPNLFFNISVLFNTDANKGGVDIYYADDNDFTFQSIKYANMVVSEIKSSKLNLKVNGMSESDMPKLRVANGPAVQVDINLKNVAEDKMLLTNEDKLNSLAKMIYACIERISKS